MYFLVFMILSALLIWFLSTETLVNVSLLENHYATSKLNSNIQGFANKEKKTYRVEFTFN